MAKKELKIYSVTQITALVKAALEETLPAKIIVSGEISDWKIHTSGHCYFTLKDENAVLPCVMWSSKFKYTKFKPENGLACLATGYIDIYLPQGKYQFYADKLEPAGVGALQLAFEQMRKRLEAQGLFDEKNKKPLPSYPMRIGIVTSETGAAVHDITDSIHSRWPCAKLFLYPVLVQGEQAAEDIAQAVRDINKRNNKLKLDILIVGRGGGSLEDLWPFNEEILARAIFASTIPIISAVGHEVDVTIADLVADARASTPTKAGVIAVPDIAEVFETLENIQRRIKADIKANTKLAKQNLETILASRVFKNPLDMVLNRYQQLDQVQMSLSSSLKILISKAKDKLRFILQQVNKIEPHRLLGKRKVELSDIRSRLLAAQKNIINQMNLAITAQANKLSALNPKSVLKRGYSITANKKSGRLIKNVQDVEIGDIITTELAEEKSFESKVTKK